MLSTVRYGQDWRTAKQTGDGVVNAYGSGRWRTWLSGAEGRYDEWVRVTRGGSIAGARAADLAMLEDDEGGADDALGGTFGPACSEEGGGQ